jgi:predicted HTH domain antitoxin
MPVSEDAKFLEALRLFESGCVSSGRAAEICEMPRVEFLLKAGRAGVPVADLDPEELDQEFGSPHCRDAPWGVSGGGK